MLACMLAIILGPCTNGQWGTEVNVRAQSPVDLRSVSVLHSTVQTHDTVYARMLLLAGIFS